MNILMVDDFPDNLKLLEAFLKKAGYAELLSASGAVAAYEMLARFPVDMILLDVMMPEISGIEVCRKIKSDPKFCDIPVIMVTACSDMECLEEAFEAGAVDYVSKPVKRIELIARVRSVLKLKGETDRRKRREKELEIQNQKLEKALSEIRTLQGLLPICSYCKKIRDVEGLWHQLESYLMSHSDVQFTHGICQECLKTYFPQYSPKKPDP